MSRYKDLLQSLMPQGRAWTRAYGSVLYQFLDGLADELQRVEDRSIELRTERDTRTAYELLEEHEDDLDLPDSCSSDVQTIQERRVHANAKLIMQGRQDKQYFIDLADELGWTITIEEYSAFICGVHLADDDCGDDDNFFYWKITINVNSEVYYFLCGSSECGDYLLTGPTTGELVCILNKYKPAHTVLLVDYDGPAFDRGFSSGFDALPSTETAYVTGGFSRGFDSGFDIYRGGGFDFDGFDSGFSKPN